jgi:hypothetical protein
MSVRRLRRCILAKGRRHAGECYNLVLDEAAPRRAAWLRVDGQRESLLLQDGDDAEAVTVAEETYILSPCFAGGLLFWSEAVDDAWLLRAVPVAAPGPGWVLAPVPAGGRPLRLSACRGAGVAYLLWEAREGKRTRLYGCVVRGTAVSPPFAVTTGEANAYDPVGAVSEEGELHVAYSAFRDGNYRIDLRRFGPDGEPRGGAMRLSGQPEPCCFPALAPAAGGGVWAGYTCFDAEPLADEPSYVQHHRRRAQLALFKTRGTLYVYRCRGERLEAVMAPRPEGGPGPSAAGWVYPSVGAVQSRLFEDARGRLRILLRQHLDREAVAYEEEIRPVKARDGDALRTGRRNYPALSLITLGDRHWSAPAPLLACGHHEEPLSCAREGDRLLVGVTQDGRVTGWGLQAEWFDDESEIGVGRLEVGLEDEGAPQWDWRPHYPPPRPGPSLEEPPLPAPEPSPTGRRPVLGQTHKHTSFSVCQREVERDPHTNYRFFQDVQHLDFGGIADHTENMWLVENLVTRKVAAYYHAPGAFVSLPAYEWAGTFPHMTWEGGPFGHVNPLWLAEEGDLPMHVAADRENPGGSLPRLCEAYRTLPVLLPPHHVVDESHRLDWRFYDPSLMPVVEIFQDHRGSGEAPGAPGMGTYHRAEEGHWIVGALREGRRFGFIGGGDHMGVALAGLHVRELTREGLREALAARRAYATTGLPVWLHVAAGETPQGGALAAAETEMRLRVHAAEPVAEIHIVRNGATVERLAREGCRVEHAWTVRRQEAGEFWYCRVLFANGEVAWSSPIWIE